MVKAGLTLSNGERVTVRRLGLFELDDNITRAIPDPYTYEVRLVSGETFRHRFDSSTPRKPPEVPHEEAQEGTSEYYDWREYLRYEEALQHQEKQIEAYAVYCRQVAEYIMTHCVDGVSPNSIQPEDYAEIYRVALCPMVTFEEIYHVISQNFEATFDGRNLLDALNDLEPGLGSYNALKVWEIELMTRLRDTEEEYTDRSTTQRARMIAADKVADFIASLNQDRAFKEAKSKSGKG